MTFLEVSLKNLTLAMEENKYKGNASSHIDVCNSEMNKYIKVNQVRVAKIQTESYIMLIIIIITTTTMTTTTMIK